MIVKGGVGRIDLVCVIMHSLRSKVAEVAGQRIAEIGGKQIHLFLIIALAKDPEEVFWDFDMRKYWIPIAFQDFPSGNGGDVASVNEGAGDVGNP